MVALDQLVQRAHVLQERVNAVFLPEKAARRIRRALPVPGMVLSVDEHALPGQIPRERVIPVDVLGHAVSDLKRGARFLRQPLPEADRAEPRGGRKAALLDRNSHPAPSYIILHTQSVYHFPSKYSTGFSRRGPARRAQGAAGTGLRKEAAGQGVTLPCRRKRIWFS